MATKKQVFARQRNWAKARVSSVTTFDRKVFTEEESLILDKIKLLQKELITNWDRNSVKLGLTPKKQIND